LPVVLFRVDDRLIHGQVTVAWGAWLSPDRIVLVNDDVAGTEWKREMYSATDSMGVAVSILSIAEFVSASTEGRWKNERVLTVVEGPRDLLELVRAGVNVEEANIGGMHHAEGKRELLPYVYADETDVATLRELSGLGVRLDARDVPQARSVDLSKLLDARGADGAGGSD
jgi:mannose/fructose/N-acetylgalactosamine-specific phosphotransferase system component IIB